MEREQKKLLYLVRPAAGGMREHLRLLIKHFSSRYSTHLAAPRSEGERQAWEAEARGLAAEIIPLPLQEGLEPGRSSLPGLAVAALRRMRPSCCISTALKRPSSAAGGVDCRRTAGGHGAQIPAHREKRCSRRS